MWWDRHDHDVFPTRRDEHSLECLYEMWDIEQRHICVVGTFCPASCHESFHLEKWAACEGRVCGTLRLLPAPLGKVCFHRKLPAGYSK